MFLHRVKGHTKFKRLAMAGEWGKLKNVTVLPIFQRYHWVKKFFFYHVWEGLQGHEHTAHSITAKCVHKFHACCHCPRISDWFSLRLPEVIARHSVSQNYVFLHLSSHFFGKQPHRQQRSTEWYEPSLSVSLSFYFISTPFPPGSSSLCTWWVGARDVRAISLFLVTL